MRVFLYNFFIFLSKVSQHSAEFVLHKKSKLLKRLEGRSLYELPSKKRMLLNQDAYLDSQIINKGIFEKKSTEICNRFIKSGDVVIDVGANIGYYTIMFADLVGEGGHVFAFEPTQHFRSVLEQNLSLNTAENVSILNFGLSNKTLEAEIDIGPSSATMHSPEGYDQVLNKEKISLKTFNDFVANNKLKKLDFIKIDVDGHEPYFFEGAWDVLEQYNPIILFEISHLHYFEAGVYAWDFYDELVSRGYKIFHETDLRKITSKNDFLRSCADFSTSCNVIVTKREAL